MKPMTWTKGLAIAALAAAGTRGLLGLAALLMAWGRTLPFSEALRRVALDPWNLAMAQGLAFALTLGVARRLTRDERLPRESLSLLPCSTGILAWALVAGAALQFPLTELGNLLRHVVPMPLEQQLALRQLLTPDDWLDGIAILLAIMIVAPVAEELLFRGVLLPGLARRYGNGWAVVISALLFGCSHLEPVAVAYATVAGLVLGFVFIRTRSVAPAIALHAGANAVPLLLPERLVAIPGFNVVSEEVYHLPVALVLMSLLVAVGALVMMTRSLGATP